jgi:L-alanine-DL-glutamate epimerase-like enolase superfamily enzyme
MRSLDAAIERFETSEPFVIARGAKHHVDVVRVTIRVGLSAGRGEGTPIYYRGDDAEAALAAIGGARAAVEAGASRADLLEFLPAGAARNALDSALWDLEAKQSGVPVWRRIGLPVPRPMLTAVTVSLGEPGAMAASAARYRHRELLKLKLGGEGDEERVRAVRAAAPNARLIADANQSWAGLDIDRMCALLHRLGVELIEQPLPAGADADLRHVESAVPLAADESCHTRADLDQVIGRYRFVNVKLDKAGGLTEALALIQAARLRGLGVMTGCMLSSSLGVAPAFLAAMQGAYADLDAPLLLKADRAPGLAFSGSDVHPPEPTLWG